MRGSSTLARCTCRRPARRHRRDQWHGLCRRTQLLRRDQQRRDACFLCHAQQPIDRRRPGGAARPVYPFQRQRHGRGRLHRGQSDDRLAVERWRQFVGGQFLDHRGQFRSRLHQARDNQSGDDQRRDHHTFVRPGHYRRRPSVERFGAYAHRGPQHRDRQPGRERRVAARRGRGHRRRRARDPADLFAAGDLATGDATTSEWFDAEATDR